ASELELQRHSICHAVQLHRRVATVDEHGCDARLFGFAIPEADYFGPGQRESMDLSANGPEVLSLARCRKRMSRSATGCNESDMVQRHYGFNGRDCQLQRFRRERHSKPA